MIAASPALAVTDDGGPGAAGAGGFVGIAAVGVTGAEAFEAVDVEFALVAVAVNV